MKMTHEEAARIANLAHLAMTPEEIAQAAAQMAAILSHVETLNQVDTTNIDPTSHVVALANVARIDEARPSLPSERVLSGAPDTDGRHFRVPKIVGG